MKFLKLQKLMLALVGYNLQLKESILWKIYTLIHLFFLIVIIEPESAYVWDNIDDIQRVTDGLCPLLFGASSLFKLLTIRFKRKSFYKLIWQLEDMWKNVNSQEEESYLDSAFKSENLLSFPYILSTAMVGVLYLSFPIVMSSYEYIVYKNATWVLPMRSIFIYDITVTPNYELTYLWFIQATFLSAFGTTGIDTLFYASAFNLSGHFQIIQHKLNKLNYESYDLVGDKQNKQVILSKHFIDLVRYHNETIKMCETLNKCYLEILFAHFVISSVQICVIGYQLTLPSPGLVPILIYSTFLMAISFQCFVYCHGGSRLEVESEKVANAIYNSKWYTTKCSTQKLIPLFLMRSQKYVAIKSVFFCSNLETLTSILSTAGSYIALLKTVAND